MGKRGRQAIARGVFLLWALMGGGLLGAESGGVPVLQEAYNPLAVEPAGSSGPPKPSFGPGLSRILRFYPPVETASYPWLRLSFPRDRAGRFSLVFADRTIELSLPAAPGGVPVYVTLPPESRLTGVRMPLNAPAEAAVPREEAPEAETLRISWETPSVLEFPAGAAELKGELVRTLTLRNDGPLRLEGIRREPLLLRPFDGEQRVPLYPGAESALLWRLSPLESLRSIAFAASEFPPFPTPLPAEMVQMLDRPRELWRREDFELYSWSRFPRILVWDCADYAVQDRFFRRLAFFVEKRGFRGTLLSDRELKGRHGWNAHDYRTGDLADFFNRVEEADFPLYEEEWLLLEILLETGLLRQEEGRYVGGPGAVLSFSLESPPRLRERFLVHEATHGLYFRFEEYREFVRSVWEGLAEEDRRLWRFFLGNYSYDPEDEDLMINEFQAYLLQQIPEHTPGYFDLRLRNLLGLHPQQRPLLERGIGENSRIFGEQAEKIGLWIGEKWGLLPGDFFPLRKEPPHKDLR